MTLASFAKDNFMAGQHRGGTVGKKHGPGKDSRWNCRSRFIKVREMKKASREI